MLTLTHTASMSASAHVALEAFLDQQRELWNAALQERVEAYRKAGKSLSFYDQCKSLTEIRRDDMRFNRFHAHAQRSVLNKLHKSFQAFFRRIRQGEKPGFPRFRGRNRAIHSFDIPNPVINRSGKYHVLHVKGIGKFRFVLRKGYETAAIQSARIVRTPCRVNVQLLVETTAIADTGQAPLGVDVGIKSRIALSNGIQHEKRSRDLTRRTRLQKKLSKAVKGSNSRVKKQAMLAKENQRIALSERNTLHRLTSALVRSQSNKFYIEDLNIRGMVKNRRLAKSIHEQTWGLFREQLAYKAENAGGWVKAINPRNTSQICNACQRMPENRLTLSDRTYVCAHCGYTEDRDLNAAKNILRVGLLSDTPGGNSPAHGKNERQGGRVETSYHAQQYVNLCI